MYLESTPCLNNQAEVMNILTTAVQILFGARLENINNQLFVQVYASITERFIGITIQDVQNSFKHAEIEKKQYTALTRDELLQPIKDYWKKKEHVQFEIDGCKAMEQKEIDSIQKEKDLKQLAKNKYIKSLKDGVMLLDEFESNCIARIFTDRLDQPKKDEIWKNAKSEYRKRNFEEDERMKEHDPADGMFITKLVPSEIRIYSRLFIEECLNKGYKYIQD